jgi:DnaK suppressor protein
MDRERIGRLLRHRRRELTAELDRLTAAPRDPASAVSFGKRIGDGTTEAVERISTTAVASRLSAMAHDIDLALERLDRGTLGDCDRCGGPISEERREAIPWTLLCVSCSAVRHP